MAESQQPLAGAEPATTAAGHGTPAATGTDARGNSAAGEDGEQQPAPLRPSSLVPGAKATRLQSIYAQALGGTLKKLSWANFAGCYPTIAKRADGVLRKLQEQMANQLQGRCEVCRFPLPAYSLTTTKGECRDGERERE